MTTKQREKIAAHGRKLQAIFPATSNMDPVDLCRKVRRIEAEGRKLAEDRCNVPMADGVAEIRKGKILVRLNNLLGFKLAGVPVFLNGDPRGYALKIDDAYSAGRDIPRDWGGYGLIAPDID